MRAVFSARSWTPGRWPRARVAQADGAEPDGIRAGGHDLNGHTALVDGQVAVKVVERRALGGNERRVNASYSSPLNGQFR